MFADLLRRFASREALTATAAQFALTWGANHLATVTAQQAEQIAALTAELERTTAERDHTLEAVNVLEDERAALRQVVADYAPSDILNGWRFDRSDTDPLGKGDPSLVVTEDPAGRVESVALLEGADR